MATGMKDLLGKQVKKEIPFVGSKVEICKLSAGQVAEIQSAARESKESGQEDGMQTMYKVLRMGVVGAADITNEEFATFPIDEMNKVAEAVMEFSGLNVGKKAD
jgi:hypothetical protein